MSEAMADTEPRHLFDDSRRLLGPNRHFDRPAAVLTALGAAAHEVAAHERWAHRVRTLCAALAWPDPDPRPLRHPQGTLLAFAAPEDALFTATELNEWAWERCAADAGDGAAQGWSFAQPQADDVAALMASRVARERSRPLARMKAAAHAHGLPGLEDDDAFSIGAGSGSVSYPRAALPLPMDVPWQRLHDVPTILVTGSNGKTTTTRLLAAIAHAAGMHAGHCSTEGVVVDGVLAGGGDYAGPAGARAVLRHRAVDFAVLETARGGLLRRGLAVRRADAAIVTNVSADHLGEYGIASVEDIAEVKLVVAHALSHGGTLVLNADDAVLTRVAARTPHAAAARQALFARDHGHPALVALRLHGGATCGARAGHLVLAGDGAEHDLGDCNAMPLTVEGAAAYNLGNIASAALAAHAAGLPVSAIAQTLATFGSHPRDNPGRLERWSHRSATVLIDYAHNPDGLAQLLQVARALAPRRLGLLLGQAGNRGDDAIAALAQVAVQAAPDRVVIKELALMLRGRTPGEVPALIERGLLAAGLAAQYISRVDDEEDAALALLAWAQPGDVVVLPVHTGAARSRLTALLANERDPRAE